MLFQFKCTICSIGKHHQNKYDESKVNKKDKYNPNLKATNTRTFSTYDLPA